MALYSMAGQEITPMLHKKTQKKHRRLSVLNSVIVRPGFLLPRYHPWLIMSGMDYDQQASFMDAENNLTAP